MEIFPGRSAEVALIIAGIHGLEESGVEVVNWVLVKLRKRLAEKKLPAFTTIVIPIVFPETYGKSREFEWPPPQEGGRKKPVPSEKGKLAFATNRQYPPPGQPRQFIFDLGGPASPDGVPITRDANGQHVFVKYDKGQIVYITDNKDTKGKEYTSRMLRGERCREGFRS